jgi:hypothetical protein
MTVPSKLVKFNYLGAIGFCGDAKNVKGAAFKVNMPVDYLARLCTICALKWHIDSHS